MLLTSRAFSPDLIKSSIGNSTFPSGCCHPGSFISAGSGLTGGLGAATASIATTRKVSMSTLTACSPSSSCSKEPSSIHRRNSRGNTRTSSFSPNAVPGIMTSSITNANSTIDSSMPILSDNPSIEAGYLGLPSFSNRLSSFTRSSRAALRALAPSNQVAKGSPSSSLPSCTHGSTTSSATAPSPPTPSINPGTLLGTSPP